jgi:hypothetical protein
MPLLALKSQDFVKKISFLKSVLNILDPELEPEREPEPEPESEPEPKLFQK